MLSTIANAVAIRRNEVPPGRALLVGLSGIDGSGKGYVAGQVVPLLRQRGFNAEAFNVDGWLNLPPLRFDAARPAEVFYERALRLDEMFAQLILPLRDQRSIKLTMDWVDETATAARPFTYNVDNLDIIILEGAYIYKRAFRPLFDLAIWIDCSWETALERSIARAQEGLPPDETVRMYRTTYFPAEVIHFHRDHPRGGADLIVPNDPRLATHPAAGA